MTTVKIRSWAQAALPVKLPTIVLATAGLVTVAVIGYQIVVDGPGDGPKASTQHDLDGSADLALASAGLSVSGDVTRPISPGVTQPVDLQVSNPTGTPVTVTGITVRLTGLSAPAADPQHPCTSADFVLTQAADDLSFSLGARESRSLSSLALPRASWPHVGMVARAANQDGCKLASLSLEYSATGTSGP